MSNFLLHSLTALRSTLYLLRLFLKTGKRTSCTTLNNGFLNSQKPGLIGSVLFLHYYIDGSYGNFYSNFTWKTSDAFIGYQKDTPAAVIFQATNQLRAACCGVKDSSVSSQSAQQKWFTLLGKYHLMHDSESNEESSWKHAVSLLRIMLGCTL